MQRLQTRRDVRPLRRAREEEIRRPIQERDRDELIHEKRRDARTERLESGIRGNRDSWGQVPGPVVRVEHVEPVRLPQTGVARRKKHRLGDVVRAGGVENVFFLLLKNVFVFFRLASEFGVVVVFVVRDSPFRTISPRRQPRPGLGFGDAPAPHRPHEREAGDGPRARELRLGAAHDLVRAVVDHDKAKLLQGVGDLAPALLEPQPRELALHGALRQLPRGLGDQRTRDGGQEQAPGGRGGIRRVGDARPHRVRAQRGRVVARSLFARGRRRDVVPGDARPGETVSLVRGHLLLARARHGGRGGGTRRDRSSAPGARSRDDAAVVSPRRNDDVTRASRSRRVSARGRSRASRPAPDPRHRSRAQRRHRRHRVSSPRLPAQPPVSAESPVRADAKSVETTPKRVEIFRERRIAPRSERDGWAKWTRRPSLDNSAPLWAKNLTGCQSRKSVAEAPKCVGVPSRSAETHLRKVRRDAPVGTRRRAHARSPLAHARGRQSTVGERLPEPLPRRVPHAAPLSPLKSAEGLPEEETFSFVPPCPPRR